MKNDRGHAQDANLLIRLRTKPHHIKQSVSVAITLVIFSAVVFVFWSSSDARSREAEVQAKTVSPLDGVTSMFDGFMSGFKSTLSGTSDADSNATSTDKFDFSGIVVIDETSTTSKSTSTAKLGF